MVPTPLLFPVLVLVIAVATCQSLPGDSCQGKTCVFTDDVTGTESANYFLQFSKNASRKPMRAGDTENQTVAAERSGKGADDAADSSDSIEDLLESLKVAREDFAKTEDESSEEESTEEESTEEEATEEESTEEESTEEDSTEEDSTESASSSAAKVSAVKKHAASSNTSAKGSKGSKDSSSSGSKHVTASSKTSAASSTKGSSSTNSTASKKTSTSHHSKSSEASQKSKQSTATNSSAAAQKSKQSTATKSSAAAQKSKQSTATKSSAAAQKSKHSTAARSSAAAKRTTTADSSAAKKKNSAVKTTESHKTVRQVRVHKSRPPPKLTNETAVKTFDCNKYRTPVQVMMDNKAYKEGYIVAELDTDAGEYREMWRIPYSATTPSWSDINACGINPIDSMVYCTMFASGAFIIRLDAKTIEVVAWLPWWIFNSGAFGPSGNFYLSNFRGFIMVAENLHERAGYSATDLKAAKTGNKLLDLRKAPRIQPDGWFATSDLVAVEYDFGTGEGEYVMSAYGPHLQVAKYDVDRKKFTGSWKLNVSPSRWDNVYGAGWNFNGRLYFASNRGSGVYEIPLEDISLDSSEKIVMPKIVGNEASLNNDGFNCMQMGSPFITTIMPFDCTSNPGPIQLIKVDMDEANFTNWRLPAKEYTVATANFTSGQNEPIYTIPSNLTDPAFVSLNAAGISPKDSIAYGTLKLDWWKSADEPSPFYVVRFDSGKIEYLAKVQGDADAIAGSFDSNGTFFVASHPHLYKFPGIDSWKGYPNATAKAMPKYSQKDAMLELKDRFPVADMVMIFGTFDGGKEAEYILSINQRQQLSLTNIKTEDHTIIPTNKVTTAEDGIGGNFGAAWNFNGNIYFSSNDGDGVYKIPLADIDTLTKQEVELEKVGESITVHDNDGMNCMTARAPVAAA